MARQQITKIHSKEVAKATSNSSVVDENSYVVEDGKTLRLRRFTAGHEYTTREARITFVWRTSGGDEVLMTMYGSGSTSQTDVDRDLIGNGTDSLVIQLINGDTSGKLHMTGIWEGIVL